MKENLYNFYTASKHLIDLIEHLIYQASPHYAKEVIDWLNSKKIEFVPKYLNPANAPKTRPIEDFWGNLKGNMYAKNWSAKSIPEK